MNGSRSVKFGHPAQYIVGGFAAAIALGTLLLLLPWSTTANRTAPFVDAVFTSTSAVTVTGLAVVDIGTYWSPFGQAVILVLIQAGGLGIMTLASLILVSLSRRLGLKARMAAQVETKTLTGADVKRVIRNVVLFSLASELIVACILTWRFWGEHDQPFGSAVYQGVFHAVSSFNNAGISTYSDSMAGFSSDTVMLLVIALAVIVGGIGFPVAFELAREWRRPRDWSVLTRVTVVTTAALLVVGTFVYLIAERDNPATFGPMSDLDTLVNSFFGGVMPRSGGFSTVDIGELRAETNFATNILMFIGGGSAGTAGGIKVTTFGLLAFVIWAQMRGERSVVVGRRALPADNERQAITVALLSVGLVAVGCFLMLTLSVDNFEAILFETISAIGTVGLSTGITSTLSESAHYLLVVLMFVGRIGPLTIATALALRSRSRSYSVPEERMIIG